MHFIRARSGVLAVVSGLFAVTLLTGCAASADGPPDGSASDCTAYAYHAIERHIRVTSLPAECDGLTPEQVSWAAAMAIRKSAHEPGGAAGKVALRRRAFAAASWVHALITQPASAARQPPVPAIAESGSSGGGRLGGISEWAVGVAALLAWAATAASGAYVLLRWLLAAGRRGLRGRGGASAPLGAAAGHAGFGLAGLVLWALFTITGWAWLAWACLVMLIPVAGLGMSVLLLGLPAPRPGGGTVRPGNIGRPGKKGPPWAVITAHGIAAATLMLLVIIATVAVALRESATEPHRALVRT